MHSFISIDSVESTNHKVDLLSSDFCGFFGGGQVFRPVGREREGKPRKDRLNEGWDPDLSEFGKALPKGAEGHRQTDPDNFYKRST